MDVLFTKKTLDREGCTLHYWVSASAGDPWVLLLHGAGTDCRTFDSQYPALVGKYNLLTMDIRGAGLSRPMGKKLTIGLMVDDTLAVLDREGIGTVTIIGHSLGGNLAQEIVFRHPERANALAFIDCTCNTMKLTTLERLALWCSPAIFAVYPEKTLIRQSAAYSALTAEARQYLMQALGTVGKKDFVRIMGMGSSECLHYDENFRIGKPTLMLCGEHDGTGNIRKCMPLWAKREPQCEFHWIKDAGHCAHMDCPDVVNGLLVDFLSRQIETEGQRLCK
jgi:pimeloyl-ACP methyl ester carboxylesterase